MHWSTGKISRSNIAVILCVAFVLAVVGVYGYKYYDTVVRKHRSYRYIMVDYIVVLSLVFFQKYFIIYILSSEKQTCGKLVAAQLVLKNMIDERLHNKTTKTIIIDFYHSLFTHDMIFVYRYSALLNLHLRLQYSSR